MLTTLAGLSMHLGMVIYVTPSTAYTGSGSQSPESEAQSSSVFQG